MRNPEATALRLAAIKELGVRIAIDDFGTGYSSLAHLQQFPVDALKIDRSFISRLTQNPEGETLIHTLVQLGKALSIETLAEGIELQQELSPAAERAVRQRPGLPVRQAARGRGRRGIPRALGRRRRSVHLCRAQAHRSTAGHLSKRVTPRSADREAVGAD